MIDQSYNAEEGTAEGLTSYLPSILWQRRWWFIVPTIIGVIAGVAAAFVIPPRYRSSATLLVEAPEVKTDASAAGTSVIDRRIAKIRQQLLSRPNVISIIENDGLFVDERDRRPISELVERVRKATSIAAVSADIAVNDKDASAIAFNLSFDYNDAQRAQAVAQDLVERLLKLDASQTSEEAANSVTFLQGQTDSLAQQIGTINRQIQSIKAANGAALSSAGMAMMTSGDTGAYDAQIASLERDNAQLSSQLRVLSTASARDPAVVGAEAQLAAARATYSDNNPDVRSAEARLQAAKRFAGQREAVQQSDADGLRNQIAANNAAIGQLRAGKGGAQARSSNMLAAQSRAPAINEQVAQLQAKADGLRTDFDANNSKLIAAKGNAQLGSEQKGERLTVIDPPVAPEDPNWPNRPIIVAAGLLAGLFAGFALTIALELFLRPVRGIGAVARLTGRAPLVAIPRIETKARFVGLFRRRSHPPIRA